MIEHVFRITIMYYNISSLIVNAVTFPLDITKTRLQIQGQQEQLLKTAAGKNRRNAYRGMLRTLVGISMCSH